MWPWFLIDHMFFRKRHWHLISEWTLVLVDIVNHFWYETSLLPQAVLKHVVSWDFILKNSSYICMDWTSSVSCQKHNLEHCFISDFSMSFYIKKTSAYGSYVGHIQIIQWVNKCDPLSTCCVPHCRNTTKNNPLKAVHFCIQIF